MANVWVVAATADAQRAEDLAIKLSLPCLRIPNPALSLPPDKILRLPPDALPDGCIAYLGYRNARLHLFPADTKQSGPICVDFAGHAAAYRLQSGSELIVKAVRGRSKENLHVLDATAGLGRDSFVLAASGFNVTLIERNAVVAALLRDGLQCAEYSPAAAIVVRMHLVNADALTYFAGLSDQRRPDVIYLDPMFAHTEKTALVKKEMRLFRQLLDSDRQDETQLFTAARACARLRVVVKRALKAPCLADVVPAYALAGKTVRFDVYPAG